MPKELEEGQIVLCTVVKIIGTTVFVNIEDYNKEGTIITSEIAPGRIRNLRDYVSPERKIVCKILRISGDRIDLSLRRVTTKEKREVIESHEKERGLVATLKTLFENAEEIIKKIKQESSLTDFFEQVKEAPKLLEKLMSGEEADKLLKILQDKKEKEVFVKKKFSLSSQAEDGIIKLKKILPQQEAITYIAAGKFILTVKDKKYKDANAKIAQILQDIEKKAKQEGCSFAVEK